MSKRLLNKILYVVIMLYLPSTFFAYSFSDNTPRVLILRLSRTSSIDWGGISTHTLTLYKKLLDVGANAHILVPKNSPIANKLQEDGLPFFTFKENNLSGDNSESELCDAINMYIVALDLCTRYNINIIHVNFFNEIALANKLRSDLEKTQNVNVVFQQHGMGMPSAHLHEMISAFITFDKASIQDAKEKKLDIKSINFLPPMTQFNKDKKIEENLSKEAFFKKRFNIKIPSDVPVLCCVGHFFTCKNHERLFKALHSLIYKYKKPVHLVLAGEGTPDRTMHLKKVVQRLKIKNNVSFLGFVHNVQELLFYSDIKVLVSKKEPFGLAAIEAALMKKPMVISQNIGIAGTFIVHNKTGLLCDPFSTKDITQQIKYLLENKAIAQSLGAAAYNMVKNYYLEDGLVLEYLNMYKKILQ